MAGVEVEGGAQEREPGAMTGMVQAVVAELHEALGQHMLEEAAQELVGWERAGARLAILRAAIADWPGHRGQVSTACCPTRIRPASASCSQNRRGFSW